MCIFLHTLDMHINCLAEECTIASKINGTPKGAYLPISKLHSILAVANLLAHNSISQICYCGQISLQNAAVTWSFSGKFRVVTFILQAMVPESNKNTRHSFKPSEYNLSPIALSFVLFVKTYAGQILS